MKKKAKAKAGNNRLSRAGFAQPSSSETNATPQRGLDESVGAKDSQEAVPMNDQAMGTSIQSTPTDSEKLNASFTASSSKDDLLTETQAMGNTVGGALSAADALHVSVRDVDSKQGSPAAAEIVETALQEAEKTDSSSSVNDSKEQVPTQAGAVGSSVEGTRDKTGKLDISVAVTDPKEVSSMPAAALGASVECAPKEADEHNISVSAQNSQQAHRTATDTSLESATKQNDQPGVSVGVSHSQEELPVQSKELDESVDSAKKEEEELPTQSNELDAPVDSAPKEEEELPPQSKELDASVGSAPKEEELPPQIKEFDALVGSSPKEEEELPPPRKELEASVDGSFKEKEELPTPSKDLDASVDGTPKEAEGLAVSVSHNLSMKDSKEVVPTQDETKDSSDDGALKDAKGFPGHVEPEISSVIAAHCQRSTCGFTAEGDTGSAPEVPDTGSAPEVAEDSTISPTTAPPCEADSSKGWSSAIQPGDYTWRSQETQSEGILRLRPNGQWWHAIHRHAKERGRIVDPQNQRSNRPAPPVDVRRAYKEHTDEPDAHALDELQGKYEEFEVWEMAECLGSWQEVLIPGAIVDGSQDGQVPQPGHGVLLFCEHCEWKTNFPNAPLSLHPDKEGKEEVHEMVSAGSIKLCYALRSNLPTGDTVLEFLMTSGDVCDAGELAVTGAQRRAHTKSVQVAFQTLGFGRKYTQQSRLEPQTAE